MARRGGSLYISTDPLNVVPIGTPGVGISIGPMGTNIYNASAYLTPADGSTVQVAANPQSQEGIYNIDGPTPLAALTINFAAGYATAQQIAINFFVAVAALTFTGGPFAGIAVPTAATVGLQLVFVWNGTAWARTV